MATERHLLFAVLAFENELIDLVQLTSACRTWAEDKSQPLADLLIARGWLTNDDRAFVEKLVDRKLAKHQHDPRVTLNSIVRGDVSDAIQEVGDADIQQSLSTWPSTAPVLVETLVQTEFDKPKSRYTWLSEVGKGGLGKVWLAHDNDLVREVALKEIRPDRSAGSQEAVRRLIKEAQITGQLQHPNIVPVYEVNRSTGRPFYTMKLVKGESLAKAIKKHHQQRRAAQSGAQRQREDRLSLPRLLNVFANVCEALAYAHSRGVIHRDLKPENIVLGDYGEAIVLDWGLAKQIGIADESNAPVIITEDAQSPATHLGATPGTPAYMAPEQASGQVDRIDHRTDIYGLGAILFEILTGHPPHRSHREEQVANPVPGQVESQPHSTPRLTVRELLQHICVDETPHARDSDPSISLELDAICAKAMSKRQDDRYPDAKSLVADVRRYLSDEPTSVCAEPFRVHVRRWVKHHPMLVVGTAATVLISLVSLTAITSIIGHSNRSLATQNSALEQANQREHKAMLLAEEHAETAAAAREQAQLGLKSLVDVIFDIQHGLEKVPGTGEVRRALLQTALVRFQEVSDQFASQPTVDRNTHSALIDLGDVLLRIGSDDAQEPLAAVRKAYQQAFDIAQKRTTANSLNAQTQRDLALSYDRLGDVCLRAGEVQHALEHYQNELLIRQKLADAEPSDAQGQRDLSISFEKLGDVQLQSGHVDAALRFYQQGLAISQKLAANDPNVQAQSDLSVSYNRLGDAQLQSGQATKALESYQRAFDIDQKLATAAPHDAQAQRDLSISYQKLGDVQLQSGQVTEALRSYQQGLEISQKLAAADPHDHQPQHDLSVSFEKLGNAQLQSGQVAEALHSYHQDLEISQKLAAADPHDARAQRDLSVAFERHGDVQFQSGQMAEALGSYQKAFDIDQKLAAADPSDAQAQLDLVVSFTKIGTVQQKQKQYEQAIDSYGRGLKVLQSLKEQKRLSPANEKRVETIEQSIAECKQALANGN